MRLRPVMIEVVGKQAFRVRLPPEAKNYFVFEPYRKSTLKDATGRRRRSRKSKVRHIMW